jgi:hypothetical protein
MSHLYRMLYTDFHEKASLVKGDVATATTMRFGYPRVMLPSALSVSPLLVARCIMRSVLIPVTTDAAIFRAVSPQKRDQVCLRSRLV